MHSMTSRSTIQRGYGRNPGPSKKRLFAAICRREANTQLSEACISSYYTAMSSSPQLYEPNISIPVNQSGETLAAPQFQSPFPFTKLPAEIRIFILEIILIGAVHTCVRRPLHNNDERPTSMAVRNVEARTGSALTLSCKLLYHEGMPTYYTQTTFEFYNLAVFRRFIEAIGPTRYHRISSVHFKATEMLMWQILAALRGLKLLKFELSGAFSSPSRPEASTKLEGLCRNSESLQPIKIASFAPSRPMCCCGFDHLKFVDQQLVACMKQLLAAKRASGMDVVRKRLRSAPIIVRLNEPIYNASFWHYEQASNLRSSP